MNNLVLYGFEPSPPHRAVVLTLKILGLQYECRTVDILKGEHMAPEFLKKNPQHTVPTLEYNGNFIHDSHAIIIFLVEKFGKDDSLYPKDPLKRAICNQRMFFNSGILFPTMRAITIQGNVPKAKFDAVRSGFEFLEKFLEGHLFVSGNTMTIADICCAASAHSNTALFR
uniref:Uncharacterized protein n=1 Tax=Megaselia scalaris TaxID=36166 RepID=T1H546_MEGSC